MDNKQSISILCALLIWLVSYPAWARAETSDCNSPSGEETADLAPQPLHVPGAQAYVYQDKECIALRLHVFNPPYHEKSDKRPVVVFFFGGGWKGGKIQQFVPQAQYFSQRGLVAIVADYRVKRRHGTPPAAAMSDARAAVRWVRSNAEKLGIDPERLIASGGSAGGHLALSTAIFEEKVKGINSKPNAIVAFNPVLGAVNANSKAYLPADPEELRSISPLEHIRDELPPTLILQGREDISTPHEAAVRFCAMEQKLGNICKVVGYEGVGHGFFNPKEEYLPSVIIHANEDMPGDFYRQSLFDAEAFLAELGYFEQRK